ncbi:MAG: GNAT family N-acetyltransferase, partial [Lentisphaerota bacterium]
MVAHDGITIRRMTRNDLDQAVEWAAEEGWNPGLHDADTFFATDPSGFFMAFDGDQPVGSISAVAYDDQFGFIGFFIVKPAYRGHRVGIDLGNAALNYLESRNIGLDGVESKVKEYQFIGFKLAYNNERYEGITRRGVLGAGHIPATQAPFDLLDAFDRLHVAAPRQRFLSAWIKQTESTALASMDQGEVSGYGVIRPCRKGYKIGPLFAKAPSTAEALLDSLIASVPPDQPFYLDLPCSNAAGIALAQKNDMKPIFKTARMYNKFFPFLPV